MTFTFAAGRAALLSFCVLAAGASPAHARDIDRGVRRFAEQHAAQTDFSGTILVTQSGRTVYSGAFGPAERAFATPARADTLYPIASITKLFTSVLVLQLVEAGQLQLDAPFGTYYPDYLGAGGDRVTVRQLLNHTSGIAQFDTVGSYQEAFDHGIPNYQRPLSTTELLQACCTGALTGEPGARFEYNNADYFILGQIIERLSGLSYEAALSARILDPLGLRDTGMLHWDAIPPRLATTYFFRDDTQTLVRDMPVYWENWYAAGGLYADAADLARFSDALFGEHLINAASLRELLTPDLDEYGLGLWSYAFERNGRRYRVAKRPGSSMGANSVLYRLLDQNITIVILANTNRADIDVFAQRLAQGLVDNGDE